MENLVDEFLLIFYDKVIKLNLEREFIFIFEKEIKRRGLFLISILIKYYMEWDNGLRIFINDLILMNIFLSFNNVDIIF